MLNSKKKTTLNIACYHFHYAQDIVTNLWCFRNDAIEL